MTGRVPALFSLLYTGLAERNARPRTGLATRKGRHVAELSAP